MIPGWQQHLLALRSFQCTNLEERTKQKETKNPQQEPWKTIERGHNSGKDNVIKKHPCRDSTFTVSGCQFGTRGENETRSPPDSSDAILLLTNKPAERKNSHLCSQFCFLTCVTSSLLRIMPRRRHRRHNLLFLLPAASRNLSRSLRGRVRRMEEAAKETKTLKEFVCPP